MTEVANNNTNQQKAYIWVNSSLGALPGTGTIQPVGVDPGSNISDAMYNIDLGLAQMKKYSKYTVRVAQFQLEANNTAAVPNPAAYTELRDQDGKRVTSLIVCLRGLPRDMNTICANHSVQAVLGAEPTIRQDAIENIYCTVDAGGVGNGYCAIERPLTPKFVCTKQLLGPLQLRVEIRDAGSTKLVSGGWAPAPGNGAAFRSLPPFNLCLEVEGIAGFEEFPVPVPQIQPNLTNGVGTGNHFAFSDGDNRPKKKKPVGGQTLIGY